MTDPDLVAEKNTKNPKIIERLSTFNISFVEFLNEILKTRKLDC